MNHKNYGPGSGGPDRPEGHEPDETERIGAGFDGLGDGSDPVDEDALRRLLQGAVNEIEPSTNALEHLRRAVPARRTRRRQALVGGVAAIVLAGVSLPALVHVATQGGGANDRPANAASSERTSGSNGGKHGEGSGGKDSGQDSGHGDKGDGGKGDGKKDDPSKGGQTGGGGSDPDPSETLNVSSPSCTRVQLGNSSAVAQVADAEGRVYGTFRVANVSGDKCTVEGGGLVGASAQGGADSSRVEVVDHVAGDAAAGLPDPSTQQTSLVLEPGQVYEIKFAWVPAAGGGTTGCSNTSTTPPADPPGDSPEDNPSTGGPGGEEPTTGSVALSYTPEAGGPAAASTTLSDACAGTIYRTGLLPGA